MQRQLFSRAETADLLGVSVRMVDYLHQSNRLPSIKLGRRRMFARDSIVNFVGVEVRGRMDA